MLSGLHGVEEKGPWNSIWQRTPAGSHCDPGEQNAPGHSSQHSLAFPVLVAMVGFWFAGMSGLGKKTSSFTTGDWSPQLVPNASQTPLSHQQPCLGFGLYISYPIMYIFIYLSHLERFAKTGMVSKCTVCADSSECVSQYSAMFFYVSRFLGNPHAGPPGPSPGVPSHPEDLEEDLESCRLHLLFQKHLLVFPTVFCPPGQSVDYSMTCSNIFPGVDFKIKSVTRSQAISSKRWWHRSIRRNSRDLLCPLGPLLWQLMSLSDPANT